jgi:DNA-binding NtrC family response regulator
MEKGLVLIVDDDDTVRKSLARAIEMDFYKVCTAVDAKAALQIMRENPVDVVISDLRMAGVHGLSLLRIAKDNYPDVIRIVLTGFGDLDAAIAAINEIEIFRFYLKPCNDKELMAGLEDAMRIRRTHLANQKLIKDLSEMLNNIKSLETKPKK